MTEEHAATTQAATTKALAATQAVSSDELKQSLLGNQEII